MKLVSQSVSQSVINKCSVRSFLTSKRHDLQATKLVSYCFVFERITHPCIQRHIRPINVPLCGNEKNTETVKGGL